MSPKQPAETLPAQTPQAVPEVGSTVPSAPPAGSSATDPTQVKPTAPVAANPTDPTMAKPTAPMVPPPRPAGAPAIDGYAIERELARGGMGVVYRARDLTFGRTVAVKSTLPGISDESFVREAEITARLQHPGIPPVHALGRLQDGRRFLAMKLISGETLRTILDGRADPTADRGRLVAAFEQICQAVGYAHARGVIHRDLKPANVMVGQFGEVQVMDWGLAKEVRSAESGAGNAASGTPSGSEETVEGNAKGTPVYMPPEQARGEWATVGPRSDVFALGGILCAILTGKPPFAGTNVNEILDRAARADLTDALALLDASGADADLIALCKVCLAARPEDRYADGTAVAQGVAAYRASVEERTQRAERDRAAAEARATEEANTRREAEARADAERAARTEAEARANAEAKTLREQRKRSRAQLLLACAVVLLVSAGGAFAWYSADRKATEAQLEGDKKASDTRANAEAEFKEKQARQGIDANLVSSANLRKVYNFAEADRLLVQALELAKSGAPDRVAEVERAREDLAFVVKLDDIRFRKWAWVSEIDGGGDFNTKIASPEYSEAFAKFGLDLKALAPADAAARIATSKVKAELVAAVDDWALYEPNPVVSERLLGVARRVDPGTWLNRLRDLNVRANKDAVEQLEIQTDVWHATPTALSVLAELMKRHDLDPSKRLTDACAAHPREFELHFVRGQWHTGSANGEQIGAYEAARALRPENGMVWHALGTAQQRKGNTDRAIAAYTRAIELAPNFALAHSNLGVALSEKGDAEKAITAHKRAIELTPQDARAHSNFGNTLLHKGDVKQAIATHKRAIELEPKLAKLHTNLGNALRVSGDTGGAIAAYERAIQLDHNSPIAYYNLGNILRVGGSTERAIAMYKRAIELGLASGQMYTNLGIALGTKGDKTGAIVAHKRAVELEPNHAIAHTNLGNALRVGGDLNEAIAAHKRAIELEPKFATAHANLGVTLRAKGDIGGATVAYRRAAELEPKYAKAHFNLGNALRDNGDVAGAIESLRRAVELEPKYATAHTNLGAIYLQQGRLAEATTCARAAIEVDPRLPNGHALLGNIFQLQGDLPNARAALTEAARLDKRFAPLLAKLPPVAVAPAPREK